MSSKDLIFQDIRLQRGAFSLHVNATFPHGKLTVILGPSGCGKTTLLDLAAGFVQPDEGIVCSAGLDVTHLAPEKRRVGVVFQDHALFPHMSVQDNVAFGPRMRGLGKQEARKRARKYLELTRMDALSHRRPATLSGGERQRVALARALAIEPDLLLLDEPFSALDAALRRELRGEVLRIQKETGITAVLVTHDQEEALAMADHLALMRGGEMVQMGPPQELWENPTNLFTATFLGRASQLQVKNIDVQEKCFLVETGAGILSFNAVTQACPNLPATVVFRPEALTLWENPMEDFRRSTDNICAPRNSSSISPKTSTQAPLLLQAKVRECIYHGGSWTIKLGTSHAGDEMEWDYQGALPPQVGCSLIFQVRPESLHLLPHEALV
ncbi:MAG: ABC transporter ATP-binding protein [Spirochaetales bacterium]|nr:ABC transporter ATP-binding protein [Spirochaetales bacterium]